MEAPSAARRTVAAGDLRVSYLERGTGKPVVFVHGNWATSAWWEETVARLPDGLRGLAYDMRGRGETTGPAGSYAIAALARDLGDFADALALPPFHVVGHSLGSAVAMQFALAHPGRLRSLTVVAPAWVDGMPRVMHSAAHQQALKADRATFARALRPLAPAGPFGAAWDRLVAAGHAQRLEAALGALDALCDWAPGDALGRVGVPTTVITGAQDLLTGAVVAARAAAALAAELIVLEGVGHCPNIEAPDRFAEVLVRVLARASVSRPG